MTRPIYRAGMLLPGVLLGLALGGGTAVIQAAPGSIELAPAIAEMPHADAARGTYYRRTLPVTIPAGTLWLAATPDGQGDLCTDDQARLVFLQDGQQVAAWSHQFAHTRQQGVTCLPAQDLTGLVPPGDYTVRVELDDLFPDTSGSQPYYLVHEAAPQGDRAARTPTPAETPTRATGVLTGQARAGGRDPMVTGSATQAVPTPRPTPVPTVTPTPVAMAGLTDLPAVSAAGWTWMPPGWAVLALLGGGLVLALLVILLVVRRPRGGASEVVTVGGIVYLYDQETRQAQTAVLTGQAWQIYRHPVRLVPVGSAEAQGPALAQLYATSQGLVLHDAADDGESPLVPGSTVDIASGSVRVQYQA